MKNRPIITGMKIVHCQTCLLAFLHLEKHPLMRTKEIEVRGVLDIMETARTWTDGNGEGHVTEIENERGIGIEKEIGKGGDI